MAGPEFGWSVDIDNETIVVGMPDCSAGGGGPGAAFAYAWNGSSWVQQAALLPPSFYPLESYHGYTVAVDEDTAVVGQAAKSCLATSTTVQDLEQLISRATRSSLELPAATTRKILKSGRE